VWLLLLDAVYIFSYLLTYILECVVGLFVFALAHKVVVAKICKNFHSYRFFLDSPVAFSSVAEICVFY